MTEKENLLRTLNFDNPEWMPYGPDCMDVIIPTDVLRERPPFSEGDGYDWFGIYWKLSICKNPATNGYTCVPGTEILKDITEWRNIVKFPDIQSLDWTKADEAAATLDRENKLSMIAWESGPWERIVSLMGHEEAMVSLHTEPEAVKELMEAITDFKISLLPKIKEHYNPDMICILEDVAHHKAPFMSNEMYRELIKPYDLKLAQAIRAHGMMYVYHSCGNITPMLDEILDLEPIIILGGIAQSNDQILMEEKFGERVCFINCMNTDILSIETSTNEALIAETRRCVDTFKEHKNLILDPGAIYPEREKLIRKEFYQYTKGIYQ